MNSPLPEEHRTPVVLWITGLSGAGKTTIGRELFRVMFSEFPNTVLLDGDAVREMVGDELGHSPEERLLNARRLSRMCRYFSLQGHNVVCATMSLFPEIWDWNRKNIPGYIEIYLRASREALVARDTKGVYEKFAKGTIDNVIGWDLSFNEPDSDLILNTESQDPNAIKKHVQSILAYLTHKKVTEHGSAAIRN